MELDLLHSLPKPRRDIRMRAQAKNQTIISVAKKFGSLYWDGPREYGYGGYYYDGRWRQVARDIIAHYGLRSGMRVLDIGCGKGFLVKDLMLECPGLEVFGIDVSKYALLSAPKEIIGRLHWGGAERLMFPDNSFDCVVSINVLHNLPRPSVIKALEEIERVCHPLGNKFVVVDSYYTERQKAAFEAWVLTAEFHDYPTGWLEVFVEAGYTGDWAWTIIEEELAQRKSV
jgi:ubiquinone/menaquinone biosynthesis C-methylase UbiE